MRKVVTVGTFDILHPGHEEHLREARSLGDHLLTVVIPDYIVYKNKREFPYYDAETRAANLRNTQWTDEVSIDCLFFGYWSIIYFRPDVFVFGSDQRTENDKKTIEYLEQQGINPEYYNSISPKRYHSRVLRAKMKKTSA
ncbi:adenylyltransferase/cytidyltransferase family protein [Candidatus Woesearchaeota archaeon]|nr:adenylyltransferase/cytidyltransferase family protein [Candidatus Woesearchaeota archaeon]